MSSIISGVKIESLATWLPKNKYSVLSFCDRFPEAQVMDVIKATGAETVYRADEGQKASDMCVKAAEYLFNEEKTDKTQIDGVVFVSSTRDWMVPDTAASLQHRLGLPKDILCQDINYGCAGYIYGLLQASMWIHCGLCNKVLVLTCEVLGPYLNSESVSSVEVSDAACACIVGRGDSNIGFHLASDGTKCENIILPYNGQFFQDGMTVFTYGISHAPKSINSVMEIMNWQEPDVQLFALHQSNNMIIKSVRMSLKSNKEKFPTNMKDYGNTSCSTIPLLLCDLYGGKEASQPERAILCAYGSGLTCGSAAVDVSNTHFYKPIHI